MNNFIFSAEEINLMCIFDITNKTILAKELRESLPDIYDIEMREIYESTIEKLEKINDEDFADMNFSPANDFDEWEI